MPHLLTDEQNRQRVKVTKKLLQIFQTCDKNSLPMSPQVMKIGSTILSNKIWATKHSRRPIIAKRYSSARKVWYAIFFSGEGVAIKVPVEKESTTKT